MDKLNTTDFEIEKLVVSVRIFTSDGEVHSQDIEGDLFAGVVVLPEGSEQDATIIYDGNISYKNWKTLLSGHKKLKRIITLSGLRAMFESQSKE